MTCNTVGPSTPHLVELKSGFLEVDLKKSQGELQMGGSPPQYTQCEQRREGSVGVRWELEPPAVMAMFPACAVHYGSRSTHVASEHLDMNHETGELFPCSYLNLNSCRAYLDSTALRTLLSP